MQARNDRPGNTHQILLPHDCLHPLRTSRTSQSFSNSIAVPLTDGSSAGNVLWDAHAMQRGPPTFALHSGPCLGEALKVPQSIMATRSQGNASADASAALRG